jgi:hypothetical protein
LTRGRAQPDAGLPDVGLLDVGLLDVGLLDVDDNDGRLLRSGP